MSPSDWLARKGDEGVGSPAGGVPAASAHVDDEDTIATDGDNVGCFGDHDDSVESDSDG